MRLQHLLLCGSAKRAVLHTTCSSVARSRLGSCSLRPRASRGSGYLRVCRCRCSCQCLDAWSTTHGSMYRECSAGITHVLAAAFVDVHMRRSSPVGTGTTDSDGDVAHSRQLRHFAPLCGRLVQCNAGHKGSGGKEHHSRGPREDLAQVHFPFPYAG